MKKYIFYLAFLLLSLTHNLIAQNSYRDSLLKVLNHSKQDTFRVKTLLSLCWEVVKTDPMKAKDYGEEALVLSEKLNYKNGVADACNKLGIIQKITGNYAEAMMLYNKSLRIFIELNDLSGEAMVYTNMGNILKNKGEFVKALDLLTKALKITEKIHKKDGEADLLLNIGLLHYDMNNTPKSRDYLNKSLKIATEMKDLKRVARALLNIASLYDEKKPEEMKQALEYNFKALEINTKLEDLSSISMCLTNIGSVYIDMGEPQKASAYYLKSLKIKEEINDRRGMAILNENIALILKGEKKYAESLNYYKKALLSTQEIGDDLLELRLKLSIAEVYFLLGDFKNAYLMEVEYRKSNDSIYNKEVSEKISEISTQYETEKKDKEIKLLQKDKEIQDKEISRQRTTLYAMIGIILLVGLLGFVSWVGYVNKKKANLLLAKQKLEIEIQAKELAKANTELKFLNKELEQQKEEITAQRDAIEESNRIIEAKNRNITDSIKYAQRIQQAILPSEQLLEQLLEDYFVLYIPKDIVSGDFYWVDKLEEKIIFAAVDCTGHGVPGAFMSILGSTMLHQAVSENNISEPAQILNFLSKNINTTLRSVKDETAVKDGMDLVLCQIDKTNMILKYSGVHNSMLLVRDKNVLEYKPDRHPIGEPFNDEFSGYNQTQIELKKGDSIYVFSDGYIDQFGGPSRKKFLSKRLKETLIEINALSMDEQKKHLATVFDNWKGEIEQYDDVLIFGIRLT